MHAVMKQVVVMQIVMRQAVVLLVVMLHAVVKRVVIIQIVVRQAVMRQAPVIWLEGLPQPAGGTNLAFSLGARVLSIPKK
jgi:hypothetical protein